MKIRHDESSDAVYIKEKLKSPYKEEHSPEEVRNCVKSTLKLYMSDCEGII